MKRPFLIILSLLFFFREISAQELPFNTQVFLNPYFYNPAFAGFENRPAVTFGSRQQWSGIEGAPQTLFGNFHTAFAKKIPFGINVYSDQRGLLSTTHSLLTLGFKARIDENNHFLSFAISGGAGFNSVDLSEVNVGLDPVLSSALENSIFLDGNAGLLYHNNGFNLGISLPKIFVTSVTDTASAFTIGELSPLSKAIALVSYKWKLSEDGVALDPWIVYHHNTYTSGQLEASMRIILKNFLWIGGGYRLDYGASAFFGINIKDNFRFGYAYELPTSGIAGLNNASHEFQLSVIFGKVEKKKKTNFYDRRRQMLNTMRGDTPPATTNQNLYNVQNDPFKTATPPAETPKPQEEEKVDLDKFMEGYQDPAKQQEPEPVKETTPTPLPAFDTPKQETVTTRDERGIYIGPKVVSKGDHLLELDEGYYVIVGTFGSYREAEEYSDRLFMQGFYTKFGYISQTTDYYVYLFYSADDYQECEDTIERFKQITTAFRDMWVLTVQ